MELCQTCRHFVATRKECHESPPKAFLVGANEKGQPLFTSAYPTVHLDTIGCGSHIPDGIAKLN